MNILQLLEILLVTNVSIPPSLAQPDRVMSSGGSPILAVPVPQQYGGRHERVPEAEGGDREGVRDAGRHLRAVPAVRREGHAQERWHVLVQYYVLDTTSFMV